MDCLFCKIINKEIPGDIVYEDEQLIAFNDIDPKAPTHALIIPRQHIATLNEAEQKDKELLGAMLLVAKNIAQENGIADTGYRLVLNVNPGAGQSVFHIHVHVLGGRNMLWPPG